MASRFGMSNEEEQRTKIMNFLKVALPAVTEVKLIKLRDHLMGPDVECGKLSDLRDVPENDFKGFIGSAQISRLKRKINELPDDDDDDVGAQPSHASAKSGPNIEAGVQVINQPGPSRTPDDRSFTYKMDWKLISPMTLSDLDEAKKKQILATPNAINDLKRTIAKDIKIKYDLHKNSHPGLTKHPGEAVYKQATEQVFAKYSVCLKEMLLEKVVSDGRSNFQNRLGTCVENFMRTSEKACPKAKQVKLSRRTVGVLPNQYSPGLPAGEELEDLEGVKLYLQNIYSTGRENWDIDDIKVKSKETYMLQRRDINVATEEVLGAKADVPTEERALFKLKKQWPFLFEPFTIEDHFHRITGYTLQDKVDAFIIETVDDLISYMISSSQCPGVRNLKVKKQMDKLNDYRPGTKLLPAIHMLANSFNENVNGIIQAIEKTTPHGNVSSTAKNVPPSPYLVARGSLYNADSYCLLSDGVVLSDIDNCAQAVCVFFATFFVLGCDYPSQCKHTLEYMERIIFKMELAEKKVAPKRRNEVALLSPKVKDFVENYENFIKEIHTENDSE